METRELICVNCPKGCRITVTLDDQNQVSDVKGYSCLQGKNYAEQECTRPMRILTTTVKIDHAPFRVIPVITSKDIPLDMMEEAMTEIRKLEIEAPIHVGEIIVKNFLDTGADLIASRSMKRVDD